MARVSFLEFIPLKLSNLRICWRRLIKMIHSVLSPMHLWRKRRPWPWYDNIPDAKLFECIARLYLSDQYHDSPTENLSKILHPVLAHLAQPSPRVIDQTIRKLRGILAAIYGVNLFKHFFDLIRPHFQTIRDQIPQLSNNIGAILNILKFTRELCTNRSNRIYFEVNIEYGIMLFREAMLLVEQPFQILQSSIQYGKETDWESNCLKPTFIIL